jgi:hypothetical protein
MAVFTKKLYMKNSAGTQQIANIYSTATETGSSVYMYASVDGTTGYIPLYSTSHANATMGRVLKAGTTYAIGSSSVPAYSNKYISTAGSGTFTVPSGVTKLRVTCVGGGAGGCVFGNDGGTGITPSTSETGVTKSGSTWTYQPTRANGGNTKFGSVVGNTATPAKFTGTSTINGCYSCDRDSCSNCKTIIKMSAVTVSKGYNNGKASISTTSNYAGGAAVPLTTYSGTQKGTAGAGGYADGDYNHPGDNICVASGASGYRTISTITVTPGQTISYTVGAGGKWVFNNVQQSGSWNTDGTGGAPGSAGAILVEWGKGIE